MKRVILISGIVVLSVLLSLAAEANYLTAQADQASIYSEGVEYDYPGAQGSSEADFFDIGSDPYGDNFQNPGIGEYGHQIDPQQFTNSVTIFNQDMHDTYSAPGGLQKAANEDVLSEGNIANSGYAQSLEKGLNQKQDIAVMDIVDEAAGKHYMMERQDYGNNQRVFNLYEIDKDGGAKLLQNGEAALNDRKLKVRTAYGDPSKVTVNDYNNAYYTTREQLNIFANFGRNNTSNTITKLETPVAAAEPLEPPAFLTNQSVPIYGESRIFGAGGEAVVGTRQVPAIDLTKDPQYMEKVNSAMMGPDQDQHNSIQNAKQDAYNQLHEYNQSLPLDGSDTINADRDATNRAFEKQFKQQMGLP